MSLKIPAGVEVPGKIDRATHSPLELVPSAGDWAERYGMADADDTWWTVPGMEDRVRVQRRASAREEMGLFVSWSVYGRRSAGAPVDVVGLLAGYQIAARDTTPACARALADLRERHGDSVQGLFHVASVQISPAFRGAGLARALYRDMVRFLGQQGLAVGPGVCYRDADRPDLNKGSTKPVAQRIWDDLSAHFPSQGFGKRRLLWGGPVAEKNPRRTNPLRRHARLNPALLSAPAQAAYDRLRELAPVLYEAVEDAYWDEEDRDGATKLLAGWLLDNGFKVLGYGGSRVVVKLDKRFAAKVAAFDDGVRQNENESGMWGIVSRETPALQDLLMPVHAVDANEIVLLTEVAKPCTGRNRAACAAEITAAQKRLQGYPWNFLDAEYTFNWGFHNGRFKLLDYGI